MAKFADILRVTLFGSKNSGSVSFKPSRDIPSLSGKVVLITGAAGGLGRQTTLELARWGRPSKIYIADLPRDQTSTNELLEGFRQEIEGKGELGGDKGAPSTMIKFLPLDLTSFASVRKCAAAFVAQETRLDLLILNAGIVRHTFQTTSDGYEVHFGLNYVGHALLSRLLTPLMLHTVEQHGPDADVRIVIVTSEGYVMAPSGGIQFDKLKTECKEMASRLYLKL